MNTLVIYDTTGYIIYQSQGVLREPVGIPFLWVDVPVGKYVESIDVSTATHVPVFVDLPKTELQILQEKNTELEAEIANMQYALMMEGVI